MQLNERIKLAQLFSNSNSIFLDANLSFSGRKFPEVALLHGKVTENLGHLLLPCTIPVEEKRDVQKFLIERSLIDHLYQICLHNEIHL